ncbi:MAG TPA: type 1 glutamine amidotransferase family protein [Bacteroidota bacterium]
MADKAVYLYVADGFADWEPGYAVAELRRRGHYRIETVAEKDGPVKSMGGITVVPSVTIAKVNPPDVAILIIPGGDFWYGAPISAELEALIKGLFEKKTPIAAICAATTVLARIGLFHDRRHTSNGLRFLQQEVPAYSDSNNYVDQPAVRDQGLITASGLAPIEFAKEIFEELSVFNKDDLSLWNSMHRSGRLPRELS